MMKPAFAQASGLLTLTIASFFIAQTAAQTSAVNATTYAPAVSFTDLTSTPQWQAWREQQAAERKLSAEQWIALEAPCHPVVQQQSDLAGMNERGIRRRVLICVAEAEGEKARAGIAKAEAGIAKAEAEGEKARAGIAKAEAEGEKARAEGALLNDLMAELNKPISQQSTKALEQLRVRMLATEPQKLKEHIKIVEEIIAMRRERKQP